MTTPRFLTSREIRMLGRIDWNATIELNGIWSEFWALALRIHRARPCGNPMCCPSAVWFW